MRESGGPILFREEDKIGIDSASRAPHQLALHQPLRHRFDISGGYADDFGDVRFRQRLLIRRQQDALGQSVVPLDQVKGFSVQANAAAAGHEQEIRRIALPTVVFQLFHFHHPFLDQPAPSVEPAFDRSGREFQLRRDAFDGLPVEIETHHDLPVGFRQISQRPPHRFPLRLIVLLLRGIANVGKLHSIRLHADGGFVVFLPQPVAIFMLQDAQQPGPGVFRLLSAPQGFEGGEKGLLGDVLRDGGIPDFRMAAAYTSSA